MSKTVRRIAAAVVSSVVQLAFAHNGVGHLRGVIQKVEKNLVSVASAKGEAAVFVVDEKTEIERGQKRVGLEALRPGDNARIDSTKEGDRLRALKLKLSEAEDAGASPRRP